MIPDFFHDATLSTAELSSCGLYCYSLTRTWDRDRRRACFVMLNPSTADATLDDPTIRRCIGFARRWNCGGLVVVNLFALRATDPSDLARAVDPVGPDNDRHITAAMCECYPVVAAWGAHPFALQRARHVEGLLLAGGLSLYCLAETKDGHPRHPLYCRADLKPVEYPR